MSDSGSIVTLKLPAGYEISGSTWLWNRLDEVSVALGIVPSIIMALFARTPDAIPEPTMMIIAFGEQKVVSGREQILAMANSLYYIEDNNPATAAEHTPRFYLPAGWFQYILNAPGYTILSTAEMLDKLQLNQ
jgi:hypothetical protein